MGVMEQATMNGCIEQMRKRCAKENIWKIVDPKRKFWRQQAYEGVHSWL